MEQTALGLRALVALLVAVLWGAVLGSPAARAEGLQGPTITSPAAGQTMATGFNGPFEVDFSDSPVGRYVLDVSLAGDGTNIVETTYDYTAVESPTQSFSPLSSSLAPGEYVFSLRSDCSVAPFCPTGSVSSTLDFSVRAPAPIVEPSRPMDLRATPRNHRATLSWDRPANPGSATIDRYQVRRGHQPIHRVTATTRHWTFRHLRNGRQYRLYARAHSRAGYSRWASVVTRPNPIPVMYGCPDRHGNNIVYNKPRHFQLACGDGNGYYDHATWTRWGAYSAVGTARQWFNTCRPYCAAGNYKFYAVRTRLHRPRSKSGHRFFTRLKITGSRGDFTTVLPGPRGW